MMFLIVLVTVLTLLIFMYRRERSKDFWKKLYAIPGPPTYPLLGNIQALRKTPEQLFEIMNDRVKNYSPIFKMWSFNIGIVAIVSPEDIEIVVSGTKHISKGKVYDFLHEWLGTGLLTSTGSKWQHRRKILTPAFHFSILQDFINIFNRETKELVEELKKSMGQPIDVFKPITEFTLKSIGETSLGVKMDELHNLGEYKNAIYKLGELFTYRLLRPWLRVPFIYKLSSISTKMTDLIKILHDFSDNIIQQRKEFFDKIGTQSYSAKKRMALMDILLKAQKEEGVDIDDEGIREEVDTFMFEGHDTTSVAISYLLFALANEPKWQEEVFQEIEAVMGDSSTPPDYQQLAEMKLMERVVKESLRLYPSVPFINRIASEDIKTFTGYIIPKGANVDIPIYHLHRSPDLWEYPEKFDPDRFLPENSSKRHPFTFIPFSAGPRNCIGQKFAVLEIKAALCGVLRNFILEPVDKPEDVVFKVDLVLRASTQIRVKFVPRQHSV